MKIQIQLNIFFNNSQSNSMQTRKELYSTLGYTPGKEWFYPDSTVNRQK